MPVLSTVGKIAASLARSMATHILRKIGTKDTRSNNINNPNNPNKKQQNLLTLHERRIQLSTEIGRNITSLPDVLCNLISEYSIEPRCFRYCTDFVIELPGKVMTLDQSHDVPINVFEESNAFALKITFKRHQRCE